MKPETQYWVMDANNKLVQKEVLGKTPVEWEDAIFDNEVAAANWVKKQMDRVPIGSILQVTDIARFHVESETVKVMKFHK